MKTKKGQILFIVLLIILLSVLIFLLYYLYQNIPGEPEEFKVNIEQPKLEIRNLTYQVKQFYPNMKFNHNSISYKINLDCNGEKKERAIDAFNELANRVELINFYENESGGDIEVHCSEKEKYLVKEDFFVAGEGGANKIVQTGRHNVIVSGVILLYDTTKGIKCKWPNIELHEILHVFGFSHSQDANSLMYSYLDSCEQKLDESIIQDLKQLYSQENLADLYFTSVEAVKKGRYLDFNVTIKNSGTLDAENVILSVFDDGEKTEDFALGKITFGGGITFSVLNLELKSRSSRDIEIVIDADNLIKEIDEENNVAKLEFS